MWHLMRFLFVDCGRVGVPLTVEGRQVDVEASRPLPTSRALHVAATPGGAPGACEDGAAAELHIRVAESMWSRHASKCFLLIHLATPGLSHSMLELLQLWCGDS